MTSLSVFLSEMKALGVHLWVENGVLKYRAPKGVLTPVRMEALKQRKPELIAFFQSLVGAPIPRVNSESEHALSNAQRRLWVLCQLDEGLEAYNIPLHQEIRGVLDVDILRRSFEALMQRHESMRTVFPLHQGEPRQYIKNDMSLPFTAVDLRGHPHADEEAEKRGREHARKRFTLETGALFDVQVLQLEDHRYVLLFTVHHIIADGVSIGVMARDLSSFYNAFLHHQPANLPDLNLQYRDYTAWQNAWLHSAAAERCRAYWLETLAGELPVLNLTTDNPRPPQQTFDGHELTSKIDRETFAAIQTLANESNVSLFMMLAAWLGVLLHRYSHQNDLIIGCPFSGRVHPDLEDQVGFYINTVPLRVQLDPEKPFRELLNHVRAKASNAHDHPYPFDVLVQELNIDRDLSRSPLFDVCLILQNQDDAGLRMDSMEVRSFIEHPGTSKFDITFCFKAVGQDLVLAVEYNTTLFSKNRIRRMIRHFQRLGKSLIQNPEASPARLEMLTDAEKQTLLRDWNQTETPLPKDETFLDAFMRRLKMHPQKNAVTCNNETLCYDELNQRAERIAASLQQAGVKAGQRVGVYVHRRIDLPALLLGVWKAGCAYVPLDPSFPVERLEFMLMDCDAQALLTQSALKENLRCESLRVICADRLEEAIPPEDSPLPHPQTAHPNPADLAYMIYTSGSTGKPKGVCIGHRALYNFLLSMSRKPGLGTEDRLLAVTTISFDIAVLELFLPLMQGGEIVLANGEEASDAMRLIPLLQQSRPTVMQATPATWRMLIEAGWKGDAALTVLCGGEALPRDFARRLLNRCRVLWNLYGPTETTVWSCIQCVNELETDTNQANVPIGRPIENTTVYLVDAQMNPVPVGTAGELLIGGVGLAQGYHQRGELTAEKFIPHPFSRDRNERVYRTGDLACRREDGTLLFLGRQDHQVKVRGFRIETGEIESCLNGFESIRQAVVIPIQRAGGDVQLAAYYTAERPVSHAVLREDLRIRLPEYMLPMYLIRLDAFPLTPNGKIDRKALPHPLSIPHQTNQKAAEPRNTLETQLLRLWKEVLQDETIGIHDRFFERGGQSITATRLVYRIQRELNIQIGLRDVFQYPTVAGLAQCLQNRPSHNLEQIQPIDSLENEGIEENRNVKPLTVEELELLND